MILRIKNLFSKIFLANLSVIILTGLVILIFAVNQQIRFLKENIDETHKQVAHLLARDIEVYFLDQRWPFETMKEISQMPNFVFLWIVDPDGKIYLADDPQMWQKKIELPQEIFKLEKHQILIKDSLFFKTNEKIKTFIHPIKVAGSKDSWFLYLGISLKSISQATKKVILDSFCLFALVSILSLGLAYFFTKKIIQPLKEMEKGIKIISDGNLDHQIKLETRDEFEELAKAFNQMTLAIKKSQAEVDKKVKEQTQEIREKSINIENQKKAIINILCGTRSGKQ